MDLEVSGHFIIMSFLPNYIIKLIKARTIPFQPFISSTPLRAEMPLLINLSFKEVCRYEQSRVGKGIGPAHQQQMVSAAISNQPATHGSFVRGC